MQYLTSLDEYLIGQLGYSEEDIEELTEDDKFDLIEDQEDFEEFCK